ncbi:MAG: hypothetical protein LBH20_06535 [Treponema sp.]|jgi:hypothetical protein|nr:hypothetical protein [Treponema sp.]
MMKKERIIWTVLLVTFVATLCIGCASATQIPPNATPEQIEQINAQNNAATATNTATLAGFTIIAVILNILSSIIVVASN